MLGPLLFGLTGVVIGVTFVVSALAWQRELTATPTLAAEPRQIYVGGDFIDERFFQLLVVYRGRLKAEPETKIVAVSAKLKSATATFEFPIAYQRTGSQATKWTRDAFGSVMATPDGGDLVFLDFLSEEMEGRKSARFNLVTMT